MAELKTKETKASVEKFLNAIPDEKRREDCFKILQLMKQVTKEEPKMWGTSIVGFGKYHYKSERSSQEGDWFITGFSPRKQNLTLYIMTGLRDNTLLKKLGKYKTGGSCLYIKKLEDVDMKVLKELVASSYKYMKEKYR